MPDTSPTTIAAFTAVIVVIARETAGLIKWLIDRGGDHNGTNGKSGEKPTSYWELVFQRIVKDGLRDHDEKVRQPRAEEASEERHALLMAVRSIEVKIQSCDEVAEKRLSKAVMELVREIREQR